MAFSHTEAVLAFALKQREREKKEVKVKKGTLLDSIFNCWWPDQLTDGPSHFIITGGSRVIF